MRFSTRQLDSRDLHNVLDLLGELHEAPDASAVSTQLVTGLREITPCDLVSYNDIDVHNPGTRTWYEPELVPRPELEAAFDQLQHQHPLVRSYAETGDPAPRRMSDFVSLGQLRSLDLWQEVFLPLETNYQIAFAVMASNSRVIGLGLNRWTSDFGDRELAIAAVLQRHVVAAYHHAQLRARRPPADEGGLGVLSARETEVLALIAAGHSSNRIAEILFLSPRTVHKHAENVRAKLGVRSRAEAAARFAAAREHRDDEDPLTDM